ncbi:MAG: hypothetical protein ACRDKT_17875 [Actinomycetota bacterium]
MDDTWSDEELARGLAWARIVIGVLCFLAPRWTIKMWVGERAEDVVSKMGIRGLGARDVAIGLGIIHSLDSGSSPRRWLEASAMADAADAIGTLGGWRDLSKPRAVMLLVTEVGAALLGVRLADALD